MTLEEKKLRIAIIEDELITKLSDCGVYMATKAVCRINERYIEIGTKFGDHDNHFDFASDFSIYMVSEMRDKMGLSIGSSGGFNPSDGYLNPAYWRSIHAGQIVRFWELLKPIFIEFHNKIIQIYNAPIDPEAEK